MMTKPGQLDTSHLALVWCQKLALHQLLHRTEWCSLTCQSRSQSSCAASLNSLICCSQAASLLAFFCTCGPAEEPTSSMPSLAACLHVAMTVGHFAGAGVPDQGDQSSTGMLPLMNTAAADATTC